MNQNLRFLSGQDQSHIVNDDRCGCELHRDVVENLLELQQKAFASGQCLQVASGYRDFSRQLLIWNEKAIGKRPVLNQQGDPLDITVLSEWELAQGMLTWSALPGASRHHWGTDFDVFNPNCVPLGGTLQLTEQEYQCGAQGEFNRWLNLALEKKCCEFFRPYPSPTGGIAPEPWHISYKPLADVFQQDLTVDVLVQTIEVADLALKGCVLDHIDEIFDRFILLGN